MPAADLIKALISFGTAIHDLFVKAQGKKPIALKDFLASLDINKAGKSIKQLAQMLKKQDMRAAIAEIDAKQATLLNGRQVAALSLDELTQYSALSKARLLLTTQRVLDAADPAFLDWLIDDALPVLTSIGPTVVQLLL